MSCAPSPVISLAAVATLELNYCVRFPWCLGSFTLKEIPARIYRVHLKGYLTTDRVPIQHDTLLTYFIATPPYRGWQRSEGRLLLRSFLSFDIFVAFSILRLIPWMLSRRTSDSPSFAWLTLSCAASFFMDFTNLSASDPSLEGSTIHYYPRNFVDVISCHLTSVKWLLSLQIRPRSYDNHEGPFKLWLRLLFVVPWTNG